MLVLSRGELPARLIDVSPDAGPTVSAVAPAASVAILGSLAENFFGHRMEA